MEGPGSWRAGRPGLQIFKDHGYNWIRLTFPMNGVSFTGHRPPTTDHRPLITIIPHGP